MNGPTQLVPYLLVRVQQRLDDQRTIGVFLIEPTFCRVTFMWLDGRSETKEPFPSAEIAEALAEGEGATDEGLIGAGQWLGGIAGAFEPRWGKMAVVEQKVMSLASLNDVAAAVDERLRRCVQERGSA